MTMESSAAAPRGIPRSPRAPREVSGLGRVRRVALVAAVVMIIPAAFSFAKALTQTSNASMGIKAVEWLRDHGAAGVVAQVESIYYSLTAPSKGGPGLKALPSAGGAAGAAALAAAEYRPANVHAMLHPALAGEGVWHATRPSLDAHPPVLVTTFRDQPEYPRVVAGAAWINTKLAHVSLNPGRLEPSVTLPRGTMQVPHAQRWGLLATFNSGFKLADSHGGFVLNGHTYATMVNGQATIVGYANGTYDVIDWQYGPTAPANVSFARQNLPLLVDNGKPTAAALEGGEWGATVGNAVLVWRSSVGVDARGNLIYIAGEDQSVSSLAKAQARAGAVRAMELDINSYWTSLITYGAPGAEHPANLLPGMERSASRYLEPDDRDFFSVWK